MEHSSIRKVVITKVARVITKLYVFTGVADSKTTQSENSERYTTQNESFQTSIYNKPRREYRRVPIRIGFVTFGYIYNTGSIVEYHSLSQEIGF